MTGPRRDGTRGLAGIALGAVALAIFLAALAGIAILGVHGAGSP